MSDIILEVNGLTKKFGGLTAVNSVSFQMKRRTIHSLIGPNGSGKTTTVNMIHGTFKPTSGSCFFLGEDVTGMPTHLLALYVYLLEPIRTSAVQHYVCPGQYACRRRSSLRPARSHTLSAHRESICQNREMRDRKGGKRIGVFGIVDLKDEVVSNLPYGRQKVCELGRALMGEPKLILLDEPAAGLNPSERREFVEILQKTFAQGIDLFLIEHNMDVVMSISDRITVLNFGSKIAEGTPKEIQNDTEVIKAYLGDRYKAIS